MLNRILLFVPAVSFLLYVYHCYHVTSSSELLSSGEAVGIALYADHATVSVQRSDTYYYDIGRVEGINEYNELMKRLSSPDTRHLSPPYHSWKDMILDQPRQILRDARKRLGLPASPDVGILVQMLEPIIDHVPSNIDSSVFVISYPALPGLESEDIKDAMLYLGLKTPYQIGFPPHEIVATYAGFGMGICKHYTNETMCNEEMKELPSRDTLLVEYTESAMFLHFRKMRTATDLGHVDTLATSFSLGSMAEATAEDIFNFASPLIAEAFERPFDAWVSPKETTVLMIGTAESVVDGKAMIGIKSAIESYGSKAKFYYLYSDYMAARGAAEMAWRTMPRWSRGEQQNDGQMKQMLDL